MIGKHANLLGLKKSAQYLALRWGYVNALFAQSVRRENYQAMLFPTPYSINGEPQGTALFPLKIHNPHEDYLNRDQTSNRYFLRSVPHSHYHQAVHAHTFGSAVM